MALLTLNLKPSKRDLTWFGLVMALFFGLFGTMFFFKFDAVTTAYVFWALALLFPAVYYGVRPLRVPLFRGWMTLVFPIGWVVSHVILIIVYYLVVTPIGLLLRLFGHEPMKRRFDRNASSYWVERRPAENVSRYFRQY